VTPLHHGPWVSDPVDPVALAALNNAVWCSILAATHGVEARFAPDACTWPARTPEGYPDAVTLGRRVDVESLLDRIDATSGCSIKDSFADLGPLPSGFEPLFDASWIRRPAQRPSRPLDEDRYRVIRDPEFLRAWEVVWRRGESGPPFFLPQLLDRDDVAILALSAPRGALGTAILNRSPGVVGLSNVLTGGADPTETFLIAAEAASRLFPGMDIVGYEWGPLLDSAQEAGFQVIGGLRVWMRE
jgi:hypothetical protein